MQNSINVFRVHKKIKESFLLMIHSLIFDMYPQSHTIPYIIKIILCTASISLYSLANEWHACQTQLQALPFLHLAMPNFSLTRASSVNDLPLRRRQSRFRYDDTLVHDASSPNSLFQQTSFAPLLLSITTLSFERSHNPTPPPTLTHTCSYMFRLGSTRAFSSFHRFLQVLENKRTLHFNWFIHSLGISLLSMWTNSLCRVVNFPSDTMLFMHRSRQFPPDFTISEVVVQRASEMTEQHSQPSIPPPLCRAPIIVLATSRRDDALRRTAMCLQFSHDVLEPPPFSPVCLFSCSASPIHVIRLLAIHLYSDQNII